MEKKVEKAEIVEHRTTSSVDESIFSEYLDLLKDLYKLGEITKIKSICLGESKR